VSEVLKFLEEGGGLALLKFLSQTPMSSPMNYLICEQPHRKIEDFVTDKSGQVFVEHHLQTIAKL